MINRSYNLLSHDIFGVMENNVTRFRYSFSLLMFFGFFCELLFLYNLMGLPSFVIQILTLFLPMKMTRLLYFLSQDKQNKKYYICKQGQLEPSYPLATKCRLFYSHLPNTILALGQWCVETPPTNATLYLFQGPSSTNISHRYSSSSEALLYLGWSF